MSISAGYIVLAVLLLRLVFKKAPKWITLALWGIVALRLICPFSFESSISLVPSSETVSTNIMTENKPAIDTGIPIIDDTINPVISENFAPIPGDSVNPMQVWITIFTWIWIGGVSAFFLYAIISYIRIRSKIRTAILLRDNIFHSENISSAFVLGIMRPRIYLPFNVKETDITYILSHEKTHIRRKDHWIKPFGFMLLAINWFNPLVWLAYILLCRDIELACDEAVIRGLDCENRAGYSAALLTQSISKKTIIACPLSFGEVGVKKRIKAILSYKKPAFWFIVSAAVVCVIIAVCFLTNPINNGDEQNTNYRYSLPLSCTRKFNEKTVIHIQQIIDYTDEGQEKIVSLLSKAECVEFLLCEKGYDYEFITPNEMIRYCSQCGRYLEVQSGEVYALPQDDMAKLNKTLGAHKKINVNNNVYKGWQGEFSEDRLLTTIQEYSKSYTPIKGDDVYDAWFTTDFQISGAHIPRVSSASETDPSYELRSYYDCIVNYAAVDMDVIVDISQISDKTRLCSYLLCLTDTEGQQHWYYFRVDYGA